jgi:CzcA family heavy metal efflux pump
MRATFFDHLRRRSKAIFFSVAVLTLAGGASFLYMPVSLFPDVTFPRIVILADNGEQPAERMMIEVTKPLEEAAGAVPGVTYVRSRTGRGSTEISVGLEWGSDVVQKLQYLQGLIGNIRNTLPPGAEVRAEQMTVSVFPILGFSLTSESVDPVELRDIALYQIRPALLRVRGIARVEVLGGETREYRVAVSPEKLAAYGLTLTDVSDAVAATNRLGGSGLVEDNFQLYLSLVSGLTMSAREIDSVVVAVRHGVPVLVRDLARVEPASADRFIRTTADGRDAVLINVLKQPGGSTVEIGKDVAAAFEGLSIPNGVRIGNFYDQGDFIGRSIRSTVESIIVGILLAMVVLIVVLRSWRVGLVIIVVVPATVATTILCLRAVGLSINIMTLGGIAAAVGLIIDDAIVVIENIFARLSEAPGGEATVARFNAAAGTSLREMMPAILGSTASTIVIHIPLAFLGGITGSFFASLSVTMVFAMLISFVLSVTLAPLLASVILTDRDVRYEVARELRTSRFDGWYAGAMKRALRWKVVVIPGALAIIAATMLLYDRIGSDFMPEMDEGTFVLDYTTPAGTSLPETDSILAKIEGVLLAVPEVDGYSRRTGAEMGFFLTEPNSGDFLVKLKRERSRGIEEVIDEVREGVAAIEPRVRIEFGQLMMDVIGDLTNNPSPVEIKLFYSRTEPPVGEADRIARLIETVPGVVDVFDGVIISGPSFIVRVDPYRAARAGFTVARVQGELEKVISGEVSTSVQRGEKLVGIRVRYPSEYRTDLSKIERLSLVNSEGVAVPLAGFARFERTQGLAEISRDGLRQVVAVTARITGRDLGSTVEDIKKKLSAEYTVPKGMELQYGGVYQTQQESFRGLVGVSLSAVLLVFIVLLFEFGEFAVPVSIFLINVLSLLGVAAALWLTGVTLNISSFVGLIMIIGIVAENAIFVLHGARILHRRGMDPESAILEATLSRKRPILMTTIAAVLALLPLAVGIEAGGQMQRPLAIAVIGGFALSSILLFFALPLVYSLFRGGRGEPSTAGTAEP